MCHQESCCLFLTVVLFTTYATIFANMIFHLGFGDKVI